VKVEDLIMRPKKNIKNDDCRLDDAEFDGRWGQDIIVLSGMSRPDLLWGFTAASSENTWAFSLGTSCTCILCRD
jgi:hypothetical protein